MSDLRPRFAPGTSPPGPSAPATTGYLDISVRRQGEVSGYLHQTIHPGNLVNWPLRGHRLKLSIQISGLLGNTKGKFFDEIDVIKHLFVALNIPI